MRHQLVLFTESFPYSSGETCLEAELPFLARYFEEVVIVPRRNPSATKPRPLPNGVAAMPPVVDADRSAAVRLIRGCFNTATLAPFWSDLRGERPWRSARALLRWFVACLLIRSYLSCPRVAELLKAPENKLFYFYWGSKAAWIAPFMPASAVSAARFHSFDLYADREENHGYIPFQEQTLRRIRAAMIVSNHGIDYLSRLFPHLADRMTLHRLGVTEGSVSISSDDGVLRILSCSSLVPVKRVQLLIEALHEVAVAVEWTHIGDGPLRPALELSCHDLPWNVKYRFIGHMDNAAVREFYAHNPVDLFVNVSRMEGVPVAVMEALSAGVPVAATAVGGTPELVDHSVGELLDVSVSAQALARIITGFARLSSQHKRQKKAAARRRAQAMCLADRNYERTAAFVARLAGYASDGDGSGKTIT